MNGNKPFSAKNAKEREEKHMAFSGDRNIHWVFFASLRALRGSIFFNGEA